MNKKELMEAYKKTEEEWSRMGIREKAKKVKNHLMSLEAKSPEEQDCIDNQILMVKELDPKERRKVIDHIHSNIMKSNMKIINSMKE